MVDVKKVTASIKKPIFYPAASTSVTNEVVNFNPLNNPVTPIDSSTVYTIDPFAIFIQEDSALKVKIPFTRFYRFKYSISLTNVYPVATPSKPDIFSVSKPILVCSEEVKIKRNSNGSITEIQQNVYNQDGSGFIVYDPVMTGPTITDYDIRKTLTPGIIEGIIELYAGDILTFEHTRVIFKKSNINTISGGIGMNMLDGGVNPYLPRSLNYDINGNYIYDGIYPSFLNLSENNNTAAIDANAFRASAAFFFEIAEITDL